MNNLVHSPIGLLHLTAAVVAMITGALVILTPKATVGHKRIGYVYVVSMLLVNLTAFLIYRLFGKFGPFHVAAIFSSVTILGGMIPILFRRRFTDWLSYHYFFMNWSVVGLYAAFWAETLVRLFPMAQFWPVVMLATLATTLTGSILIRRHKDRFLTGRPTTPISKPTLFP